MRRAIIPLLFLLIVALGAPVEAETLKEVRVVINVANPSQKTLYNFTLPITITDNTVLSYYDSGYNVTYVTTQTGEPLYYWYYRGLGGLLVLVKIPELDAGATVTLVIHLVKGSNPYQGYDDFDKAWAKVYDYFTNTSLANIAVEPVPNSTVPQVTLSLEGETPSGYEFLVVSNPTNATQEGFLVFPDTYNVTENGFYAFATFVLAYSNGTPVHGVALYSPSGIHLVASYSNYTSGQVNITIYDVDSLGHFWPYYAITASDHLVVEGLLLGSANKTRIYWHDFRVDNLALWDLVSVNVNDYGEVFHPAIYFKLAPNESLVIDYLALSPFSDPPPTYSVQEIQTVYETTTTVTATTTVSTGPAIGEELIKTVVVLMLVAPVAIVYTVIARTEERVTQS